MGPLVDPTFESLRLSERLLAVVGELGYEAPTPIQAEAIPVLLAGRDLVGQSKTGSGKTAAFALPILDKLELGVARLQALVVCPTRELAAQVAREVRKLGRRHEGLQVLVVAGGEAIREQKAALKRGVHVVVGTPGRLLDHLTRGSFDSKDITTVVLDEADRMLDMGFQEDVEAILAAMPEERQTVFFSATFPKTIEQMSDAHQRDALRVTVGADEEEAPRIRQLAVSVEPQDKLHALYRVLHDFPHESALVFCNYKATVAELVDEMASADVSVDAFSGDLEQFDRDEVLVRFRNQSVRILVATDVAGRGIDVEGLDLVVNYEVPMQPEIYVHRIGRTGRAGRQGVAVSLVSGEEKRWFETIRRRVDSPIERLVQSPEDDPGMAVLVGAANDAAKMETLLIMGGRKDKLRPGDILGALTSERGGLKGDEIGKIEIHDRRAYVAVERSVSRAAVDNLSAGRIKGKRFRVSLVEGGRR